MVKDYFLNKMIFPKLMIVDNPGIIISRHFKRLSGTHYDMRLSYTFEDFYHKLYLETKNHLNEEELSHLWYVIGKNLSIRYLSFSSRDGLKKPIKRMSNFKIRLAMKYLQESYCAVGMSVCENLKYDLSKDHFYFWGANNAVCRKTKDYSIMEGILSGAISFLLGKNIEAKSTDVGNDIFRIDLHPKLKERHSPNFSEFELTEKYKLNFKRQKINSRLHSLEDFLRFGIIKMDNKNKTTFFEKTLIPAEFSLPEIFAQTYSNFGLSDLFFNSIVDYSENLFRELLMNKGNDEEKLKFFKNMMSAFGYGQIFIKKNNDEVFVHFLDPLFLRFGFRYLSGFILGFLNYWYGCKFTFVSERKGCFVYRNQI